MWPFFGAKSDPVMKQVAYPHALKGEETAVLMEKQHAVQKLNTEARPGSYPPAGNNPVTGKALRDVDRNGARHRKSDAGIHSNSSSHQAFP
ncbi:MAG: hypothetical protein V4726_02280 [Verrucomicrobiota bacterium]